MLASLVLNVACFGSISRSVRSLRSPNARRRARQQIDVRGCWVVSGQPEVFEHPTEALPVPPVDI